MTKIQVPYSLHGMFLAGLLAVIIMNQAILAALYTPQVIVTVALAGLLIELIGGVALMVRLQSSNRFNYESIYGMLLGQYTILSSVSVTEIQVLTGVRILACVLPIAAHFIWQTPVIPWLLVLSACIYIISTIHYVPNKKPRK